MSLPRDITLGNTVDINILNPRNVETLEFYVDTVVPDFICDFTQLQSLTIHLRDDTSLVTLPSRIGNLINLRQIELPYHEEYLNERGEPDADEGELTTVNNCILPLDADLSNMSEEIQESIMDSIRNKEEYLASKRAAERLPFVAINEQARHARTHPHTPISSALRHPRIKFDVAKFLGKGTKRKRPNRRSGRRRRS